MKRRVWCTASRRMAARRAVPIVLATIVVSAAAISAPAMAGGRSGGQSSPALRPGDVIVSDAGACTVAFLFKGSDRHRYMATAGHCVFGPNVDAEQVWPAGSGLEVRDAADRRIGEYAYAVRFAPGARPGYEDATDFALIRLDRGVVASPAVQHFGGPTGINAAVVQEPMLLSFYGRSPHLGEILPARNAFSPLGTRDPQELYAFGTVYYGDSGGPILDDEGRALAVITNIGALETTPTSPVGTTDAGTMLGTRLATQLERAEEVTGVDYTLKTAPWTP